MTSRDDPARRASVIEAVHGLADPRDPAAEELFDRALPPEDREAARGANDPLRVRWIARSAQRILLAQRLGAAPAGLRFALGPEGKPELTGPLAGRLHFNLTHTRDRWAVALSEDAPVGVDLELDAPRDRAEPIARRWFSAPHAERVAARPEEFLEIWTLYEAFGKALGVGLSGGLRGLAFADGPPWPARVEYAALGASGCGWCWQPLEIPGCAGSVVSRGGFALAVRELDLSALAG